MDVPPPTMIRGVIFKLLHMHDIIRKQSIGGARHLQILSQLQHKKKKKKEKHFGRLVTFWFGTFAMLYSATGCVFRHENTRR